MKKYVFVLAAVLLFTGCSSGKSADNGAEENVKTVVAQSVSEGSDVEGYDYIGLVKAKDTKNYSFLQGGQIEEIYVEKGQKFKKGDVLAKLDATSLGYASDISVNSVKQSEATKDKTESTYDTNIINAQKELDTLATSISAGQQNIDAAEERVKTGQQEIDAGQARIETLETALAAAQKKLDAAKEGLDTFEKQVESARELNKVGGVADLTLEGYESELKAKQADYEAAQADYDGSKAELDQKRAELESSKAELTQSKAAIEKSRAELEVLKTQRATGLKTLENLKVSKEKDMKVASATVDSAKTSKSLADKNVNDTTVVAAEDGYVMELPYKKGEVIAAGYPVVVAKSTNLVVTVGVSDKEYSKIKLGQKAVINGMMEGSVETIAQYPDEDTRTYSVDIALPENNLTIGETVNVKLVTGTKAVSYLPITSIFNIDGVDYVYTIGDENRVHRTQVTKGDVSGDKVSVEINDPAAVVVTEGIKNLKENEKVKVQSDKEAGADEK